MNYRTRFIEWCQRPSKIKIRTFNPRNAVVLITLSIILATSITFGTWRYLAASAPPTNVPKFTYINPEDIETLTITTDTTLTEDYTGLIVIAADNVTLDGSDHRIIGPGTDVEFIWDPNNDTEMNQHGDPYWMEELKVPIGILLEGRTGVTVKNCRVTDFSYGIFLGHSHGNTLQGNTANDNAYGGFVLESSSNNTLLNNTANNSIEGNGFSLGRSFGNTLQGNTANENWIGFVLEESDGNILIGNTAKNNTRAGFEVAFSSNSILTGNNASNNQYGIVLDYSSNNNITGNTVSSNNDDGIYLWWSSNNSIYHNNFVNNTKQVNILDSVNAWDDGYPSGGNLWSNYKGVDANGDGIGDTPYVIDENNRDRFPLMAPISVFEDGTKGGENNKG